jgi:hypothetical protein
MVQVNEVKVIFVLEQATQIKSGGRGIALFILQLRRWRGVGDHCRAPSALSPGKTRYPWYRRLDGPQGRSGLVRKISPVPVFVPRPIQSVAIPTHHIQASGKKGSEPALNIHTPLSPTHPNF